MKENDLMGAADATQAAGDAINAADAAIAPAAEGAVPQNIVDAVAAIKTPVIEVHISNVHKREAFRQQSYLSSVVSGVIVGFGLKSYKLALQSFL